MIIIGPFIFIVNNYGSAQGDSPEQDQPPPEHTRVQIERPTPIDTSNMVYITCDTDKCEWDGHYDTPGRAKQGLAAHKSWCDKGKLFKKRPFG